MPKGKYKLQYRCSCCGYLVTAVEYETAYVFEECPRCHNGVENFVAEANLVSSTDEDITNA